MRWIWTALVALALASAAHAQGVEPTPEVDTSEVLRRGDDVAIVGEGPRNQETEALRLALAPPADDNHKWSLTLVSLKGCVPCERLKADFRKAPELLAFIAAPEESKAWAHWNEYLADDTLQQKLRLKAYKFAGYPTLILQPPRNGMWGDPATVVFQHAGYAGDPKLLADKLRKALQAYVAVMESRGYPKRASDKQAQQASPSDAPTSSFTSYGEVGQVGAGVDPPFPPCSPPAPMRPSMASRTGAPKPS
jgi:hypothetical protein